MKPSCEIDKVIGSYIENEPVDSFETILQIDERLEVASYLSELANGLWGWYPFHTDGDILQIGSWFGAFTELLCFRCKSVTVIEANLYRAFMTKKRLNEVKNLNIVNSNVSDYCQDCNRKFDYIIFAVDENIDDFQDIQSYRNTLKALKNVLTDNGKILLAFPNRLGTKYFCGSPDPNTKIQFDGITENNSGLYRFDREELLQFVDGLGYRYAKIYYPMPDHHLVQVIYTDDFRPNEDAFERIHVQKDYKTQRFLHEPSLMKRLAQNGVLYCFCNSFLIEIGNTPCTEIIYSALSVERGRRRAFATNIYKNNVVEKIPIYSEGEDGVRILLENTRELEARGIPVLNIEKKNNKIVMERVQYPTLSQHLKEVAKKDENLFIGCVDRLYQYILNSSEHISAEKNDMRNLAPDEEWGIILKKAYIEMIPVNSFYVNGDILFFDQEFTRENCPANYVLFRALRDIYDFSSEINQFVSLDFMKKRYGLISTWNFYVQEEELFQQKLRRRCLYAGFFQWLKHLYGIAQVDRRHLGMLKENREQKHFDIFSELDERRIILFGSGKITEYYLKRYGEEYRPIFIVDNNQDKWGSKKNGIEIRNPDSITRLMQGTYRVIIAIKDFESVVEQLKQMGIGEDSYRIFDREIDALLGSKINDAMSDEKYHIGYVIGAFDSFGINDLSLLKSSKANSHYLIAGVLTDELMSAELFAKYGSKKLKNTFEERFELVKQCKYVDRVIPVDSHNFDVINAWKELRFGCLFMQKEYENFPERIWLGRKLNTLGSNIEYV